MVSILLTINAIICVALVILILLQRSDTNSGGMFGGTGGTQTIVRNPLAKPTAVLAALFLVFSLIAAYLNKGEGHATSVMADAHPAPAEQHLPEASLLPADVTAPVVSPTTPVSATQQ